MKHVLVAVFLTVVVFPAAAQQIYTQPWVNNVDDGPYSCSSQQIADQFTLGSSDQVTVVEWYGSYTSGAPANGSSVQATIRFFSDVAGAPDVNPFYEYIATVTANISGTSAEGATLYHYVATIPATGTLTGGTPYWLSILSGTSPDCMRWANGTSAGTANSLRNSDGSTWTSMAGDVKREQSAYTLYAGAVVPAAPSVPTLAPTVLGALAALLALLGFLAVRHVH